MALSNIFREPRREITESVVGIVVLGVLIWADYRCGVWVAGHFTHPDDYAPAVMLGMMGGVLAVFVVGVLLFLTHGIGNMVCNALQRCGIHLRPHQRY